MLYIDHLTKTYGEKKAVDDLNLHIRPGEIYGFLGHNGAGKTTTIKSMLNLVHPDSGEIIYFGKLLKDNETSIKKHIGYSTGAVNWYPKKKICDIMDIVSRFYDTWDMEAYNKYLKMFE